MIDTKHATHPLPSMRMRTRVFFVAWQVFAHLALPFALLFFLVRSRREPLYRKHFSQRFGLGTVGAKGSVWVFATSLGETRAVSPLVKTLLDQGHRVCLTHSSPAGLSEGRRLFDDDRITHRYVPFDFWWSTWLFFIRLRPSIGLVVEGEFWPGHLQVANWMSVPMLHVNGNLHQKSLERSKKTRGLRMDILTRFHAILTKSEGHQDRYLAAGVDPDRILIVGELKFDQWVDKAHLATGDRLRATWSPDAQVFLIASSVADEEDDLIDLAKSLLDLPNPPRIIWAPRSPQRFGSVSSKLAEAGLSVAVRSRVLTSDRSGEIPEEADVLVADSIGEMNIWYKMADLVFVGGTLADKGGHNISEPLALGKPVLLGPSIFGITFPAIDADQFGAVRILPNVAAFKDEAQNLFQDQKALSEFREKATLFAELHVGATERTMQVIDQVLAASQRTREPK